MNTPSATPSNSPPSATSGKLGTTVESDLKDKESDDNAADQTITPSPTQTKEQAAEEFSRKTAEIERKVADGN